MKKFVIITDSCCDLERNLREKYDILYAKNTYTSKGVTYEVDLNWDNEKIKEFYDSMRNGERIITSQVSAFEFRKVFENELNENKDILYIGCSSGLSNTINVAYQVRDELLLKYNDAKIICIDSLNACMGLGLLCIRASELREQGQTIENVSKWIENNKLQMHQEGAVDDLVYLKRAGRVSAISSFFGGIFNIKPIIISDVVGKNAVVEKVKGRTNSINRIVQRTIDKIIDVEYQRIAIVHADCLNEAMVVKNKLIERLKNKNMEITISSIGPIIGASVGPGMLGIYFYGEKETFDSSK